MNRSTLTRRASSRRLLTDCGDLSKGEYSATDVPEASAAACDIELLFRVGVLPERVQAMFDMNIPEQTDTGGESVQLSQRRKEKKRKEEAHTVQRTNVRDVLQ